jgi:hypothetical protein
MPTIADRFREQGVQQGIQQADRESVLDILESCFEAVPQSVIKKLNEITDPSVLKVLRRKALKAKSLDEFEKVLGLMMK